MQFRHKFTRFNHFFRLQTVNALADMAGKIIDNEDYHRKWHPNVHSINQFDTYEMCSWKNIGAVFAERNFLHTHHTRTMRLIITEEGRADSMIDR